jgi:hypothetical protein
MHTRLLSFEKYNKTSYIPTFIDHVHGHNEITGTDGSMWMISAILKKIHNFSGHAVA